MYSNEDIYRIMAHCKEEGYIHTEKVAGEEAVALTEKGMEVGWMLSSLRVLTLAEGRTLAELSAEMN